MRETSARTIFRLAVLWVALWVLIPASASANQLTVYPARRIITMDPSLPSATAVAVRDDRIVAVGTMETLEPWLEAFDYEIDETFRDKVLLPGFLPSYKDFRGNKVLPGSAVEFSAIIELMKSLPYKPAGKEVDRIFLLTSFNEWWEGTTVEPAKEYGTRYLDVLRDAFGDK